MKPTTISRLVAVGGAAWVPAFLALFLAAPSEAWAAPKEDSALKCSNSNDDDGDGFIDCADASCNGLSSCEFGTEVSCGDGVDNDGDGNTDGFDTDCSCTPTEVNETSCSDGVDNDCDGKSDVADSDCGCVVSEATEVSCSDGNDNDCDGNFDAADPDCACFATEAAESSCGDGVDNDCDGNTDGDDPDCVSAIGTCPNMPAQNPNPPAILGATPRVGFTKGSLIIPMDNCYQRATSVKDAWVIKSTIETYGAGATLASADCDGNFDADEGMIMAYAVVQRLIRDGIPVNWVIKESKDSWGDEDFVVTSGSGSPVLHMDIDGNYSDPFSLRTEMRYAGAPFVIDSAYADAAKTAMAGYASAMDDVSFHEAQVDFDAPVYKEMGGLPNVAVIDLVSVTTEDRMDQLRNAIASIEMDALEGTFWNYLDATQVKAGQLISGDYDTAWVHSFRTISDTDVIAALDDFVANGGNVLIMDEAIHALEGYGAWDGATGTYSQTAAPLVDVKWQHSWGGLVYNFFSAAYGNDIAGVEGTESDDYSDPASQWGGAGWTGVGGAKFDWTARCDIGYRDGVRRMVYSSGGGATDDVEFASWKHYDNNTSLGRVYYLGGYNWRSVTHAGFRLMMNTIFVDASEYDGDGYNEIQRSAPIVGTVDGVFTKFVGTFENDFALAAAPIFAGIADAKTFSFPAVEGHYRGLDLQRVPAGENSFEELADIDGAVIFDAAEYVERMEVDATGQGCAFPADGKCRRIFTNQTGSTDRLPVTLGNVEKLQGYLGFTGEEAEFLIGRIHAGVLQSDGEYLPALGGVDRSTGAVIPPSNFAGGDRPTVAYVGGTDGMLHAICADTGTASCPAVGTELWAFMPRIELGKVATNTTRIDGSPKVADVFGDFGNGTNEYRTVLTFLTGNSDQAGVYALDITDPTDPAILWEYIPTGGGTTLAMGQAAIDGEGLVHVTYAQTAYGTAKAGFEVTAIRTDSGEKWWNHAASYPDVRKASTSAIPTTAYPAGVSVLSTTGDFVIDTVLVPTLWGSVYAVDPDGTNKNGNDPIFQFDEDYHPIGASLAVYRSQDDQQLRAVAVTGGFTDSQSPTATSWAPSNVNQYAVGFPVDHTGTPITQTDVRNDPSLGIFIDFGAGNRAFSSAVIAGNEVFVATDTSDVNSGLFGSARSTGTLFRSNISSGDTVSSSLDSGGGGLAVNNSTGTVYTGSGDGVQVSMATGFDADGIDIKPESSKATRVMWLRSQ